MKNTVMYCIALLFIISAFFSSCSHKTVYEKNKEIKQKTWHMNDEINFNVLISDTLVPYNFYINLRNNHEYQYRNIYIFLKTVFPNGLLIQDTLNIILADSEGKWLGSGIGDIKYNQLIVKKGVRFPIKGTYAFSLTHGMREPELSGITDIGIKIDTP